MQKSCRRTLQHRPQEQSGLLPRYQPRRCRTACIPDRFQEGRLRWEVRRSGAFLDPTILYPISWSDKIMEDEIFGPLLPILTYSDLGTLLTKIKSLPKPLAGYMFSRNQQAIDRVLQSLSFGGGAVNQTNVFLFIESMPYGGVGTSGIGNYYGKYGYDSLTHAKSVLISPPDVAIDHLFPPYTKEKVQALDQWFNY